MKRVDSPPSLWYNTRMKDTEKAKQIIDAIRTLDDRDQTPFLWALMGLVQIDSPQSIIDAARWSSSAEKIQKALDASA